MGRKSISRLAGFLGASAALSLALTGPVAAQDTVRVGIVSFLTGPAAVPFGIPGKNAAELIIDAINEGSLPAPYNSKGLGGATIEARYVDEAGSVANQVTEYRNLVQRDGVSAVVGYVSSGNCLAVAPVAEEMKTLTVLYDCGTPRIFEERDYTYVFRVTPTATMDSVGAARYVIDKKGQIPNFSGINQNYAWGQDSWRDFVLAMKTLAPNATIDRELFPKFLAGEYGAEITSLLTSQAEIIHTSFYGGDLESFVGQATGRGLFSRKTMVMSCGESAMFRLGNRMPDGTIIGARGPHGVLARESELNTWFQKAYTERYGTPPTYPSYHMAQSLLGLKAAWDKAAAAKGGKPTPEEVAKAFEGLEFDGPSTRIQMARAKGHQGISETAYGTFKFNKETNKPEVVDIVRYPADCVNPPDGVTSQEWLEGGMKGAKCD
ncbi:MAG: ABC transporter substrate-binding protein [Proteobacteria bacterium]|jgi:branched-chain amino acid transport system substrate-binding protein|nr:MAG: ABC transporter substrate-binding protein [Pseudomonadota bacterium]